MFLKRHIPYQADKLEAFVFLDQNISFFSALYDHTYMHGKKSDMNYSNAVFVATLLLEADCKTPTKDGRSKFETPPIDGYVDAPFSSGLIQRRISQGISEISNGRQPAHSITNASDIATIRAGYERAFSLGVSDATNALARFERRISRCQEEAKKNADEKKRKEENAKMVEVLEIDSTTPKKQ